MGRAAANVRLDLLSGGKLRRRMKCWMSRGECRTRLGSELGDVGSNDEEEEGEQEEVAVRV